MKDSSFKCPACDADLMVKSDSGSDMGEDHQNITKNKVVKQPNAATMPMGQLKNKLSSTPGMLQNPMVPPNLNSY
jgi:hypothetical protein